MKVVRTFVGCAFLLLLAPAGASADLVVRDTGARHVFANATELPATPPVGVFTGSNVASLQPVGTTRRPLGEVVFDAPAGETYHVGVGCPGIPGLYGFICNLPVDLEIRLGPD